MRALVRSASGRTADRLWLPGLPHAAAGLATCLVYGSAPCISGLLLATLASFVVYLPLTVLTLNGGAPLPLNAPTPALTKRAQFVLLGLWTLTVWAAAALTAAVPVTKL